MEDEKIKITEITIKYPKNTIGWYRNRWGMQSSIGLNIIRTGSHVSFYPLTARGKESVYYIDIPTESKEEFIKALQTIE